MKAALFCAILVCGIAAIAIGLLVPAHLRALDPYVLARVGAQGKLLVEAAAETAPHNPGVAKLLLLTAEDLQLPDTGKVVEQLREAAADRTRSRTILEKLEEKEAGRIQVAEIPVLTALRKSSNREQFASSLQSIEAKQILRTRELTNLTLFAPAKSAAGMPLDVAVLTTAFLFEQRAFSPSAPIREEILRLAAIMESREIEELYLSIFALAKRFSSEQLIALAGNIPTTSALHAITRYMQEKPAATPLLYSATILSKKGAAVAAYINRFYGDAEHDFGFALAAGSEALNFLLAKQKPVYRSRAYSAVAESRGLQFLFRPLVSLAFKVSAIALLLKFLLIGAGGFVAAYAFKFRTPPEADTTFVFFPQFTAARRGVFACVLLLLAILIGEPYLAQGEQNPPASAVHFPLLGAATAPGETPLTQITTPMIDQQTIIAIATFIAMQTLIYAVCLMKLAEIRKQPVSNEVKLKLLDNEDHLFDGGLYCGLFGTAGSLILLTLGVIKPSLVSAYSSTLFGILFVAVLKIGHVRPLKRRLLLEASPNPFAA